MGAYTLRSLRQQPQRLVASFVSLFLGATMVMAFASMFDTLVGNDGLSSTDTEALVTLGAVVGGWGLIIVVFAVASTLTLSVRQRSREMALLKSVGATPAQVGRMIVGEAAVVAVVAALAAVAPAALVGRLVFDLVRDSGQVSAVVEHRFGAVALAVGFGVTFLGATVAALVTARRTARLRARDALADAELDDGGSRLSRKRTVAAVVFLALGAQTGTLTATLMKDKGSDAMQTGGQASIWAGIGLALLAPALVRGGARLFGGLLERVGGASGYLAAHNLRRRAPQMARAVMPVIVFTAIATGAIVMQAIENQATEAAGLAETASEKTIETLNFVVVGMIAVFAAIMVINTLVTATTGRRRELAQQRLAGATPAGALATVGLESVVVLVVGVAAGSLASLATIVPYSIARTDSPVPDTGLGIWLVVVGTAVALTLGSTLGAARRALRTPAVEAAGATAA